jgi:uncharacterized protein YqgC (DUF456 family)
MQIRSWLSTAGLSTAGFGLVAVGVVGIFLPIIPGLIPIAAGMTLLARRFAWAERTVEAVRDRIPNRS